MSRSLDRLLDIMARLRDPKGGCPWDLEQSFATIAPHTLEETYELVEAIEKNDPAAIKDELGDVLFQVIFYAQLGREAGWFDFDSIAAHVADKMTQRHPHVFGERKAETANDVRNIWEQNKEAKRKTSAENEGREASVLDNITSNLPATTRAVKLQKRAARVGFDWDNARDVFAKIREEIGELEHEFAEMDYERMDIERRKNDSLEDELGDVLFAVTNLARKLHIDPETALRRTNRKFESRFRGIESALAKQGRKPSDASLEEMERFWNQMKKEEKR